MIDTEDGELSSERVVVPVGTNGTNVATTGRRGGTEGMLAAIGSRMQDPSRGERIEGEFSAGFGASMTAAAAVIVGTRVAVKNGSTRVHNADTSTCGSRYDCVGCRSA